MFNKNMESVINREGKIVPVRFDKITDRNVELTKDLKDINVAQLSQSIITSMKNMMTTSEIDQLAAEIAMNMSSLNRDYATLASRIIVSDLHKSTESEYIKVLQKVAVTEVQTKNNKLTYSLINQKFYEYSVENIEKIQKSLNYERDYNLSYFAIETLKKTYLLKENKNIIERPQHMYMRVALAVHPRNINKALETYEQLSLGKYTHATPTLYNAGTNSEQFASCFLLNMEDSIEGIFNTLKQSALIAKHAGGIGINLTKIRANGSIIKGVNGKSDGIVPLVQTYNGASKYVNQGSKRPGSMAFYLEVWHADIEDFIRLVGKSTPTAQAAPNIFIALWVCDLFMKRVEADKNWSLFCPNDTKQLYSTYGDEFEKYYLDFEEKKLFRKQIKARNLWLQIMISQGETGMPYILYKDTINRRNNQSNIGMINCSNLCAEIVQYTDDENIAVCNLSSIALPTFIKKLPRNQLFIGQKLENHTIQNNKDNLIVVPYSLCLTKKGVNETGIVVNTNELIKEQNSSPIEKIVIKERQYNVILGSQDLKDEEEALSTHLANEQGFFFDFAELGKITEMIVENLNNIIDNNLYPVHQAQRSNLYTRPMGIGVQGLADVFAKLRCSWESKLAKLLNRRIFETIYFYAVKKSAQLAEEYEPYPAFLGSQISKGLLQCDLFERSANPENKTNPLDFKNWTNQPISPYDWNDLREKCKKGVRNSLLVALMPTATTAHILGNNECIEPFTNNFYVRTTNTGSFFVFNKHLYNELQSLEITEETMKQIISQEGNIQNIKEIPQEIKDIYKTVWQIKQKVIIDLAADRSPFVDQSQSMNIHMVNATVSKLTSAHFYSWEKELKTGSYYIRSKAAIEPEKIINRVEVCTKDSSCISCSS